MVYVHRVTAQKDIRMITSLRKTVMRLIIFRKTRKHAIPLFLESQLPCIAVPFFCNVCATLCIHLSPIYTTSILDTAPLKFKVQHPQFLPCKWKCVGYGCPKMFQGRDHVNRQSRPAFQGCRAQIFEFHKVLWIKARAIPRWRLLLWSNH